MYSYSATSVPVLGCFQVPVSYGQNPEYLLELLVVQGNRPALFGRDWLSHFKTDWKRIGVYNQVTEVLVTNVKVPLTDAYPKEFNKLLQQNKVLFYSENAGIRKFTASNLNLMQNGFFRKIGLLCIQW